MPLEEYKRKRRFEETPEPPPKVEKKTAQMDEQVAKSLRARG